MSRRFPGPQLRLAGLKMRKAGGSCNGAEAAHLELRALGCLFINSLQLNSQHSDSLFGLEPGSRYLTAPPVMPEMIRRWAKMKTISSGKLEITT
jgi:hypothetical protein